MEYNISSEYADNIVDVCMEFSDDNKIKANDIVDDKVLKKMNCILHTKSYWQRMKS